MFVVANAWSVISLEKKVVLQNACFQCQLPLMLGACTALVSLESAALDAC